MQYMPGGGGESLEGSLGVGEPPRPSNPVLRQNPFIFATLLRVFFVTVLDCSPNALFKEIFSF